MLQNISIGKKIHLPIITMMCIGVIIITINATNTFDNITKDAYDKYSKNMKVFLNQAIANSNNNRNFYT